jgi:hypothetical protein
MTFCDISTDIVLYIALIIINISLCNGLYVLSPFDSSLIRTIKIAENHKIQIVRQDSINKSILGILGSYLPKTCKIVMYNTPDTMIWSKKHEITLKHELIHAIQHCKGSRKTMVPITNNNLIEKCIKDRRINKILIDDNYPLEVRRIEYEARCLENEISYKFLEKNIQQYCRWHCR